MTTTTQVLTTKQQALAQALYEAYLRNFYGQSNEPLSMQEWKGVVSDDDTGYAVQDAVMALKGSPVAGYKVSLTSEETQKMFDSDCPLYGAQVAERFVPTPCTLDLRHLNEPLVEVEFCFTATCDLTSSMSHEELLHNCTVAADMEVPDSRFSTWFPSLSKYLVLSDCAVGGYVLYGQPVDGTTLSVDDMAHVHAKAYHDGKFVKEGDSTEVLGNPVNSLAWLVKKLESQGKHFTKGMHVSVGTVFVPVPFTAGEWHVEFSGPFGTLEVSAKGAQAMRSE